MKRFLVYVEHQAVEEHSTNASDTFVFFKMRKHQGAWTVPDTNTNGSLNGMQWWDKNDAQFCEKPES